MTYNNISMDIIIGVVDSVAPFITVIEQSESNPDRSFYSSIAFFCFREIISPELIYNKVVRPHKKGEKKYIYLNEIRWTMI